MSKARFKTKLTKKQKRNNAVVFLAVAVFSYAFTLLFSYGIGVFEDWATAEVFVLGIFMTFFISSMLLIPVLIAAIALGVQKGKAQRVRDNASFIPVQNIEYYRDTLSELNPSLVSILVDLDIYGKKDIAATLLRMKNKKIVSFDEKKGITLITKSHKGLDRSEIDLLELLKKGRLKDKRALSLWKQKRFQDAAILGYIQKKNNDVNQQKAVTLYLAASIVFTLVALLLWGAFLAWDIFLGFGTLFGTIRATVYLLLIDAFIFIPWYLACKKTTYIKRGDMVWERTPLGNETAEKIAGFARFINEFSTLSEAKKEQVALWDDYLVYALVLEENEKIVKDISRLYLQQNSGKKTRRY